jgi:hypothetical protein
MSKEDIKHQINKVFDELSDKTLQGILSFSKTMEGKQTLSFADRATLDKILTEDLLEKFAK